MFWRQRLRCFLWPLVLILLNSRPAAHAQNISTSGPVPPLQWINITGLTSGASPPALKDASIGYYDTGRTLLIFGGESAQGIVQSQTYLLNLETLVWSKPVSPSGLDTVPPARSAAISGDDFAASYRSAHLVVGGLGSNNEALSDAWEFDYISQFWQEVAISPGGPSARYDAVGGIDTRTPYTVTTTTYPNNSFYLAGGINGSSVSALSDVWRLDITGTLSSNNLNDVDGSWSQISIEASNVPSKVGAAGAVVSSSAQDIIAFGGCSSSTEFTPNPSCAQADSYMINTGQDVISPSNSCPVPRLGATLVGNFNGESSDFDNQVFLVFGLFNTSLWSDDGGLQKGEVDVLDIQTGVWNRVLPTGDPGSGSTPAYPSPRQGAAGLSYGEALVGSSRSSASDSIFFGGVDASGDYLNEVWVLRAYNGQLSASNQSWSGFGDGQLTGGVNASGQGVTVQFMSQCASALSPQATQTSAFIPQPSSTGSSPPGSSSTSSPTSGYSTSVSHKALSPISLALVFPAVIGARLATATVAPVQPVLAVSSIIIGMAAYALGIAGLVTSFTTISYSTSLAKRSSTSSVMMKTSHGKAGLALFIVFYGVVPLLYMIATCYWRGAGHGHDKTNGVANGVAVHERPRLNSTETAEKEALYNGRAGSPLTPHSTDTHTDKPRMRTRSWAGLTHLGAAGRRSSESAPESTSATSPSHRSFEVVNRPARTRRASGNSLAAFSNPRRAGSPRNLSDTSWFDGRRSTTAVGEMHFPLNELNHRAELSTPGTTILDMTSTSGLVPPSGQTIPEMPRLSDRFLHILFHASLLALCILSLIELWLRAPIAAFIVFLVGTVLFYVSIVALSWLGKPRYSVLTVLLARFRGEASRQGYTPGNVTPSRPMSAAGSEVPFPTEPRGPYQHYPPFRATTTMLDEYPTSVSHGHAPNDADDDDEEDEDTRQRRIEEEMNRRDVSIVTVPRRKLFLTNPELDRG